MSLSRFILALAVPCAFAVTVYAAPRSEPRTQQESVLLDPEPAAHWKKQLQSADWLDRWQAVYALGLTDKDAEGVIPSLVEALKDKDERVQAGAADALGKIGEPALPALQQLLRSGERRQRRWAAYALGHSGSKDAIPFLIPAMTDTRDDVREKAAESLKLLGYSGKDAVRLFMQGLKDSDPAVRFHSAMALGALADPASVTALTATLDDANINIKGAACEALGRIGAPSRKAVPRLAALLSDHPFVMGFAVTALGGIGPDAAEALPLLKALATGNGPEPLRLKARWAVERIEQPSGDDNGHTGNTP